MFILVSSYGSRGQQGKRERKHQEPILDLGTLRKEVCFPQGTAISKPRACLSPSPPPCVCLHLLPSPPCSSPFLFTTPTPTTPPSLSSSFLLPGTKGRRESRESGPAGPHWINQRHRPSPGATSLLICSGGFLSLEEPGYF